MNKKIKWTIDLDMLQMTWGDHKFVANYINQYDGYSNKHDMLKNKLQEAFKFALPQLWDDVDFLKKCYEEDDTFFKRIDNLGGTYKNFKYKDSVYKFIKLDPEHFNAVWGQEYDTKEELYHAVENLDESLSLQHFILEGINSEEKYDVALQKKKIVKKIKEELFTDLDYMIRVILNRKMWQREVYDLLPIEMQYNQDMLDAIYLPEKQKEIMGETVERIEVSPHYSLVEKYINDNEWTKNFVSRYGDSLELSRLNSPYRKGMNNNHLLEYYQSWIDDKNQVLELLKKAQAREFYYFYNVLPNNLRKDKEVIEAFIDYSIKTFELLDITNRASYIGQYIESAQSDMLSSTRLTYPEVFAIEDRSSIMQLIEKGYIDWLNQKDCPVKWQTDLELLKAIDYPHKLVSWHSNVNNVLFETMCQDKDIILEIIKRQPEIYKKLPNNLRSEESILMELLKKSDNISMIPQELYQSKDFCLKAATTNSEVCSRIPLDFWQEENFVLDFFKLVDENKIKSAAITKLPKEINQVFSAFNVTKDYSKFLENFILHQKLHDKTQSKVEPKKKSKL